MEQPSQQTEFCPTSAAWWVVLVTLAAGCARATAPAPASETSAPPPTAAATLPATSATPTVSAPPPAESAPAAAPAPSAAGRASEAPSAAPTEPNPWTTPHDCAERAASAEQRDLSPEQRKRQQTTCAAKEELRAFVAARQSCTTASECSIVSGSCPFGCFVPVAKASVGALDAKLKELGERLDRAGNRCVYRCMSPPVAACVDGRCATAAAP